MEVKAFFSVQKDQDTQANSLAWNKDILKTVLFVSFLDSKLPKTSNKRWIN